jgi:hypothetical protein
MAKDRLQTVLFVWALYMLFVEGLWPTSRAWQRGLGDPDLPIGQCFCCDTVPPLAASVSIDADNPFASAMPATDYLHFDLSGADWTFDPTLATRGHWAT